MKDKKFAIIGLGLIGGSLAKALTERLGADDITGVDLDSASIDMAVKDGSISRGFTHLNEQVWNSDVIFLCTPVKKAVEYLEVLAANAKQGCIVTDVCSTKVEIVEYANTMTTPLRFVGGHPMAGTENAGYAASFPHLFENAYYILAPGSSSDVEALHFLEELIKGIGGIPVILEADEHDKITGSISHVPHIIAAALVNLVREKDSPEGKMQMLAAGGFKDITRIASSSPELWESIILSNRERVMDILKGYIELLEQFGKYVENRDSSQIRRFFKTSRDYRNGFAAGKKSLILPQYEIIADVVDKPGIIGEIATLLGKNDINIKNINVSNSREFEEGCLKIALTDAETEEAAYRLLSSHGYKVYKSK